MPYLPQTRCAKCQHEIPQKMRGYGTILCQGCETQWNMDILPRFIAYLELKRGGADDVGAGEKTEAADEIPITQPHESPIQEPTSSNGVDESTSQSQDDIDSLFD